MEHTLPSYQGFKTARLYRTRLAWSIWGITTTFVLLQFFLQLSSGEFIEGLMKSFSLTAFSGGILASSYYYIYVFLQVPAGILIDRYGPREILSGAALTVCIGSVIFATAHTLLIALIGRVFMGIGAAFAFVGCLNLIAVWFPAKRFAFMTAIVETAGMFGAIFGNLWLAHFIETTGWREAIKLTALFSAMLSLLLFFVVRSRQRQKKQSAIDTDAHSLFDTLNGIIRNPIIWINGTYCGFVFGLVTVFIALWAIPFFEVTHHASAIQATLTTSSVYIGMAIGGPLIGWLDSKTNWRRCILMGNVAAAAILLFIVIFSVHSSLLLLAGLLFLTGFLASSYVLTFAIANELAQPKNRATSIGLTNMLCVLFAPFLQPFIGFLITHLKGDQDYYQWSVSVVPALMVVAAGLGWWLPARKNQ